MAYIKTTWVNDVTPVSAANMNKIENGVYDANRLVMCKIVDYQAVSNGSTAAYSFSAATVQSDTDSFFNAGTPDKITVSIAGTYEIVVRIAFDANITGTRECQISVNGSGVLESLFQSVAQASGRSTAFLTVIMELSAGDEVKVLPYQTSGGSLNTYVTLTVIKLK